MTEQLERALKAANCGDVHFDAVHRQVYSVDASIFEIEPIGVVLPKSKEDLISAVKICREFGSPIIARGAATGITGGCLGKAVIIDTSKYLNHILEINYDGEHAICEPGVVQDQLNAALAPNDYRLGPDTSTGDRATVGGMVANNSAGARSLFYGTMADHIEQIEILLYSGELLTFKTLSPAEIEKKCAQDNREGQIYKELMRIRAQYKHDIEKHFPKIPRRVSGYNIDCLLVEPINFCKLIAGSEGTLGIITEVKLRIAKRPQKLSLCIIHCHDMLEGMHAIGKMLKFNPLSLELIDDKIIAMGRISPSMRDKLDWLVNDPHAIFVAEFQAPTIEEAQKKAEDCAASMIAENVGYAHVCLTDPAQIANVWKLRKSGLGLLLSKRTYSRAIAFIEDLSIAPQELPDFMDRFTRYLKSKGKEAGIYGHVGSGCMHIRPYIDLRHHSDVQLMEQMMRDISSLVLEHHGALSGEHGDGLIRTWLNKKMFGPKLYQAFVELKHAFDPQHKMNPGKVVHGPPVTENLRLSPQTHIRKIDTFLDFTKEGGFELAADLCNGNGLCRKSEKLMCPSFQATQDEYNTTRARAQTLRGIINGQLPQDDLGSQGLNDVLDLCLECKGCKTECPSQVDMAKMKAESLYHYQKKHGISWRSWLFANIHRLNGWGSRFPKFSNFFGNKTGKLFFKLLGITTDRKFPAFAEQTFSKRWATHAALKNSRKQVILYIDTFTEYNQPEVGIAAVKVLEAMGYEVKIPPKTCCGRPAISKGLLEQAKAQAQHLVDVITTFNPDNLPIIGLEPSCILTLKDDLQGLLGSNDAKANVISALSITFDEFIAQHIIDGKLPMSFATKSCTVKVHGHCHQKALVGMRPTLSVLKAIPGLEVSEINSGCCGLAGSFGYETEHYDLSMQIGNLHLFPAIKTSAPETVFIADGFSCRCQIAHGTPKTAIHLAVFLANALN